MENMKISDLKYLVFEGGGAKGTAYIGAIQGLESKFKEGTIDTIPENKTKCSILDYSKGKENKKPQIEGIAGTSAGAITAFALALGLNSEEIEEVSNYDFTNFLSEEDEGYYRMIATDEDKEKYQLYIGHDNNKKLGAEKKKFTYHFDERTNLWDDYVEVFKRKAIITLVMDTLIDGTIEQFEKIKKIIEYLGKSKVSIPLPSEIEKIFSCDYYELTKESLKPLVYRIYLLLMEEIFIKDIPVDTNYSVIGNIIWDRGIYSGFAVREFFFDVMIYALIKNTHFQRSFLDYYSKTNGGTKYPKQIFEILGDFKIGKREKTFNGIADESAKELIEWLEKKLTFKTFYDITKINFGLAITNSTTGASLYYSHKHTPDFPVLEAVAASMNIPGVFKPIYSEADVWIPKNYYEGLKKINAINSKYETIELYDNDNNIIMKNYYLFEKAVKKYLSEIYTIKLDTNTSINESGYLSFLRNIITYPEIFAAIPYKTSEVDDYLFKITIPLLAFFYNAAYKGLLVDGGVANNIPYNFFRNTGKEGDNKHELDGVLALKLDNEFPPDFFKGVYPAIETYFKDLRKHELESQICAGQEGCIETLQLANLASKKTLLQAIKSSNPELNKLKEKEIDKIFKDLTENFRDTEKGETPWNKATSIFNVIGGMGWDYGSEHGQVRYFSDHEHIIPLYTYGVGTMDFDLTLIPNFSDMSRKKAKEAVENYFVG